MDKGIGIFERKSFYRSEIETNFLLESFIYLKQCLFTRQTRFFYFK